jgi:hypothetical protein
MAARGRQTYTRISHKAVLRVAVISLVVFGFLLYLSVFISPALIKKLMLAIESCSKDDSMRDDPESTIEKKAVDCKDQSLVQGERIGDSKNFAILIGVMSIAPKIDRRNLLRLAYGVQSSEDAHISLGWKTPPLEI